MKRSAVEGRHDSWSYHPARDDTSISSYLSEPRMGRVDDCRVMGL